MGIDNEPRSALISRNIVTEIVAARDAAVEHQRRYFDALESARAEIEKAASYLATALGGDFSLPHSEAHRHEIEQFRTATKLPEAESLISTGRRLIDIMVWGTLIERTELKVLMDAQAKKELRKAMQFVPEKVDADSGEIINQAEIAKSLPPITEDNVYATLEQFRESSAMVWRRGVANAFSRLDARFKSHDGFSIGSRMILTNVFGLWGSWSAGSEMRDTLIDVERVFQVLDSKKPSECRSIVAIIDEERRGLGSNGFSPQQSLHEGDYFRVRCFKNGNAHLWFTCPKLVERVNQILADHYSLGYGSDGGEEDGERHDTTKAMQRSPARRFGFFPTPEIVAKKVAERARVHVADERLEILEPSAGTGSLVRAAGLPSYSDWSRHSRPERTVRHRVTSVEIQKSLTQSLEGFNLGPVVCMDFLRMEPTPTFDRVVMNPPFDRGRDIDHVLHALKFLKPGGRLTSVMSASAEVGGGSKGEAFRKKIQSMGGRFESLPPGSFREAGTMVNTTILSVDC